MWIFVVSEWCIYLTIVMCSKRRRKNAIACLPYIENKSRKIYNCCEFLQSLCIDAIISLLLWAQTEEFLLFIYEEVVPHFLVKLFHSCLRKTPKPYLGKKKKNLLYSFFSLLISVYLIWRTNLGKYLWKRTNEIMVTSTDGPGSL